MFFSILYVRSPVHQTVKQSLSIVCGCVFVYMCNCVCLCVFTRVLVDEFALSVHSCVCVRSCICVFKANLRKVAIY